MSSITSWGQNSEAAVAAFEEEIGFPLPNDYRLFIKENNGCKVNKQVFFVKDLDQDIMLHVFYGITNSTSRSLTLRYWLDEFGDEVEEKTLLFGSDPGGGFLLYITAGEDKGVYYWDHAHFFPQSSEEEGNTYFLVDSFAEFMRSLRAYEPA
jgi:hypothetical protein